MNYWSTNPSINFPIQSFLSCSARLKKYNQKKLFYYGYGTVFDGAGSWSVGNSFHF